MTEDQLRELDLVQETQGRGAQGPESALLEVSRKRSKRAHGLGFHSCVDRFEMDTDFNTHMVEDGCGVEDMRIHDLLKYGQLANIKRTALQAKAGTGLQSGVQYQAAAKLCFLHGRPRNFPEEFHGKFDNGWCVLFKDKALSHDDYVQHLVKHPRENQLITWDGLVTVDTRYEDWWSIDANLKLVYEQNRSRAYQAADERERQSERQQAKNEAAKRKARDDANTAAASMARTGTSAASSSAGGNTMPVPEPVNPPSHSSASASSSGYRQRPTYWRGKWWLMDRNGKWIEQP